LNRTSLYLGSQVVGGGGAEESLTVWLDGEERILAVNPYELFGWSIEEGVYPTLLVKSFIGGRWRYDPDRSKYAPDIRAEGDSALVDQFFRYGFNPYNDETIVFTALPTEAGQLPHSGNIVVGHYDTGAVKDDTFANTRLENPPTWTSLSRSGGVTVFDDQLRLIGSFITPNLTDPVTGSNISAAPRGICVDPSSSPGDERWVVVYDATYVSDTDGRSQMNTASPGVVATDSTFETGLGGWAASLAILAQSSTFSFSGGFSMRIAPSVDLTTAAAVGPRFRVRQNKDYQFTAQVRAGTTPREIRLGVQWRNADGNQIGSAEITNPGTTDAVGSWTLVTSNTFTAPIGSYSAEMTISVVTPALGEFHYVDVPYITLETDLSGTAATFCTQEFSWDGSTVTPVTSPFSPGPQGTSVQDVHVMFDTVGNLWFARAGGTFLGNQLSLVYQKVNGARSYESTMAIVTPANWHGTVQTPGPCDTSEEWGYEATADYTVADTAYGGIPTRPVWDEDRTTMHYLTTGSPTIVSVQRTGSAGAYSFARLGNLSAGASDLPESTSAYGATIANPTVGGFACYDSTRQVIWACTNSPVSGAWPKPPEQVRAWMTALSTHHDTIVQAIDYWGQPSTFGTVDGTTTATGHTIETHDANGFPPGVGMRPMRPSMTSDGLVHLVNISQRGNNAQPTAAAGLAVYTWDPDTAVLETEIVHPGTDEASVPTVAGTTSTSTVTSTQSAMEAA
jgi:hypothetical protein